MIKNKNSKYKYMILLLAILIILSIALDTRLLTRTYDLEVQEINTPIKIALLTDLHSNQYGENQEKLIHAITQEAPDVILLGGDIFDDVIDDTNTKVLFSQLTNKYPIYYVTGNHEHWSGIDNLKIKINLLEDNKIVSLSGKCDTIAIKNEHINLCGINDPDAYMTSVNFIDNPQQYINAQNNKIETFLSQLDTVNEVTENNFYTILLSHRPEFFENYSSYDFDLVLSGHAHGGQWRIPFLLNGLYAPNQGFLPKYAGGKYEKNNSTMIVSRGLSLQSTRIPRIFNRPELVIIKVR